MRSNVRFTPESGQAQKEETWRSGTANIQGLSVRDVRQNILHQLPAGGTFQVRSAALCIQPKMFFFFCIFENFQWLAFSGISEKEDNLARCTQIFGNFWQKICVPFNFAPGIFELWFAFSEVQQFLGFLESFINSYLHMLMSFWRT